MSSPIICEDLSKRFGGIRAVDGLNLEVPEGAIYGLLCPNGAGKTTAIKTMMNILRPEGGRAQILGVPSRLLGPGELAEIGYVSENQQLPDWMTVGYLMAYLKPFYPRWDDARAEGLLRQFGLPLKSKLRQLSRGMWMKAALTSSLAYRPRLLVLDEPFSGLDAAVREDLIQGVLESAGDSTILISSHDLSEIEYFASHVGFMDRGRLQFSEEMTSLSARFREIEVMVEESGVERSLETWPSYWLQREIRQRLGPVRNIAASPMPLRAIFITLARSTSTAK